MLKIKGNSQFGYTILEALIATAITTLVSAGILQLATSTRTLASTSFKHLGPSCELPKCNEVANGFNCVCSERGYFVVR
jgi:hypothetical protein